MTAARNSHSSVSHILVAAGMFLLLPLIIVQFIPTDAPSEYVFSAVVQEELGRSSNGQLTYYRAATLKGESPGATVVAALDRSYSRGYDPAVHPSGETVWFQGGLMTPEVFYGEQYLFFDLPQVYVRQVKAGLLWPDQWSGLRVLYLSPLSTLAAPLQLPFFIRAEEFTVRILAVLIGRCILIIATVVAVVRRRLRGADLLVAVLLYSALAVSLTAAILGELY